MDLTDSQKSVEKPEDLGKMPYEKPKVQRYGTLSDMVQGSSGGTISDGGGGPHVT